jgi:hypothetical protein
MFIGNVPEVLPIAFQGPQPDPNWPPVIVIRLSDAIAKRESQFVTSVAPPEPFMKMSVEGGDLCDFRKGVCHERTNLSCRPRCGYRRRPLVFGAALGRGQARRSFHGLCRSLLYSPISVTIIEFVRCGANLSLRLEHCVRDQSFRDPLDHLQIGRR